jgi:hypothetical protein
MWGCLYPDVLWICSLTAVMFKYIDIGLSRLLDALCRTFALP